MVRSRLSFLIAGSLFCTACGPIAKLPPLPTEDVEVERRRQQIDHIRDYFAQLDRLHSVAFRLRVANRDDCKNGTSAQIGLDAGTVASLPRKYRSFAHDAISVSWTQAAVLSVAETSPAAAAGIKPGDHLLTFNNEPVPRDDTAGWIGRFVRNNGEQPIRILVRRDGIDELHTVTPVKACAIPIELKSDSSPDAFTTGDRIVVHSSILRIARTDAQLALVIGHELAHANLGHLESSVPTKSLAGPAEQQSTPECCSLEYRPAAHLSGNLGARENGHSASVSSVRPTMSVHTMQHGRATISQARKSSGAHSPWKIPTAFVLL